MLLTEEDRLVCVLLSGRMIRDPLEAPCGFIRGLSPALPSGVSVLFDKICE